MPDKQTVLGRLNCLVLGDSAGLTLEEKEAVGCNGKSARARVSQRHRVIRRDEELERPKARGKRREERRGQEGHDGRGAPNVRVEAGSLSL